MIIRAKEHKLVRVDKDFGLTLISNDNSKILNSNGTITGDSLIVYLMELDNGTYKLGQILENAENSKQFGKLPETVWQDRYFPESGGEAMNYTRCCGAFFCLKEKLSNTNKNKNHNCIN